MSGAPLFPLTRSSLLQDSRADDPTLRARSLDALLRAYRRPVYAYIRLKWRRSPEDAAELTQAFFAHMLEKDSFDRFAPERGRFRTFLKVCVDRLVMNVHKSEQRQKRGGGARIVSLDGPLLEAELGSLANSGDLVEQVFHREWIRSLLELATDDLRGRLAARRGKHFEVFRRLVLELDDARPPSYASVAEALDISVVDVTNELFVARREFRRCVLDRLRSVCPTDEEFRSEARALLGLVVTA